MILIFWGGLKAYKQVSRLSLLYSRQTENFFSKPLLKGDL